MGMYDPVPEQEKGAGDKGTLFEGLKKKKKSTLSGGGQTRSGSQDLSAVKLAHISPAIEANAPKNKRNPPKS